MQATTTIYLCTSYYHSLKLTTAWHTDARINGRRPRIARREVEVLEGREHADACNTFIFNIILWRKIAVLSLEFFQMSETLLHSSD